MTDDDKIATRVAAKLAEEKFVPGDRVRYVGIHDIGSTDVGTITDTWNYEYWVVRFDNGGPPRLVHNRNLISADADPPF